LLLALPFSGSWADGGFFGRRLITGRLGAADASALLTWLRKNGYRVDRASMSEEIGPALDPTRSAYTIQFRTSKRLKEAIELGAGNDPGVTELM
jgi:hypothetical protein